MSDKERIEELEQFIRWLADNGTAVSRYGLSDPGCGCCGGSIDVPEAIQKTFDSVMRA